MCFHINPLNFWNILGAFFPSLVVDKQYEHKIYPLTNYFYRLIEETGYLHLQATKPDTIGLALTNSPVSLAGYILEKFSMGSNPDYRTRNDGGLLEKFTLNELLDNLMIYWVTDSFTTSARLYAEQFTRKYWDLKIHEIPINVPSACAVFPQEFFYFSEKVLHDIFEFVGKIVELSNKRK
ncbi:hypothetical protein HZH66_007672 [Vespula vulgaris]|uniref:Uncharacterized protein n=1 Tax=Vespula vulgaris TaxID=7454 RepID=A0A834JTD8_VESVU|nr:hypothetical protein HZH66_007672 [Vespula vulgaris]